MLIGISYFGDLLV